MDFDFRIAALKPGVWWILVVLFTTLAVGSTFRLLSPWIGGRFFDPEKHRSGIDSLKTWWTLSVLFAMAVILGTTGAMAWLGVIGLLGLIEFFTMRSSANSPTPTRWIAYLTVPGYYVLLSAGWYSTAGALFFLAILAVAGSTAGRGTTRGFVNEVAGTSWAMMILIVGLSHAALLMTLDASTNAVGGPAGWFAYLIVLTQTNDISQALWGRRFGKRKVTPRISPNKTWEGLLLGIATTVVVAVALGAIVTPLPTGAGILISGNTYVIPVLPAVAAGLLIGVSGFFGDIVMSGVKRDCGVKDSGTLLPGQGGMLDRTDSLTFTAPLFYYFVYCLYAR